MLSRIAAIPVGKNTDYTISCIFQNCKEPKGHGTFDGTGDICYNIDSIS